MNLQIGRICCLILILLAALETKAQVALEENNIEQYAALQLGYDSIGGNIKAQIKKTSSYSSITRRNLSRAKKDKKMERCIPGLSK